MSWWVFCCPLLNTRDCLEVCAIIILKPAGLLYMYSINMKLSWEWGMGWSLHIYIYIYYWKACLFNVNISFTKRYIILNFMCRRLVSFIILFGKLLNSVSDTFVIVVFKRLLSHQIKKGGKRILLTLKISKTFDSPKA